MVRRRSSESGISPNNRYAAGDRPDGVAFESPESDTVRYEDGLGEFETRLLLQQHLGDDGAAALFAAGWDGDRYQVLGRASAAGTAALVWYTLWDDKMAAARFRKGLESAWAKRGPGGRGVRRSEIKQLLMAGVPVVRLVDAPPGWVGWKRVPTIRVTRAAR